MNKDQDYLKVALRNHDGACDVENPQSWPARACAIGDAAAAHPNPQIAEPTQGVRLHQAAVRAARRLMLRTTVSYAYYSPKAKLLGPTPAIFRQCRSNWKVFLRSGLPHETSGGVAPQVILNVIGDTPVPDVGLRDYVTVRKRKLVAVDLFVHALTAREVLGSGAANDTYRVFYGQDSDTKALQIFKRNFPDSTTTAAKINMTSHEPIKQAQKVIDAHADAHLHHHFSPPCTEVSAARRAGRAPTGSSC